MVGTAGYVLAGALGALASMAVVWFTGWLKRSANGVSSCPLCHGAGVVPEMTKLRRVPLREALRGPLPDPGPPPDRPHNMLPSDLVPKKPCNSFSSCCGGKGPCSG